jgi:hypothetical protein
MKNQTILKLFCCSILASTILSSCKKSSDPEPSTSNDDSQKIKCKLISSSEKYGNDSTGTRTIIDYEYDSNGKIKSSASRSVNGNNSTLGGTDKFEYDANGKVVKIINNDSTYTSFEYSNGKINKYSAYDHDTLNGYALHATKDTLHFIRFYDSKNNITFEINSTSSGLNITGYTFTTYNTSGQIYYQGTYLFSNFDNNISGEYVLSLQNPELNYFTLASKNNPMKGKAISTNYTNGVASNTYTEDLTYSYTYNTQGLVTESLELRFTQLETIRHKKTYTYTNCD